MLRGRLQKVAIKVTANTRYSFYNFNFLIHVSSSPDEQRIEAKEFYLKWAGKIHDGTHHEIQIVSDSLINNVDYVKKPSKLHIHPSLKFPGEEYMCWTGHLPTIEVALKALELWCAGTIFTLENDKDFGVLFEEQGFRLLSFLESEHGIKITNVINESY